MSDFSFNFEDDVREKKGRKKRTHTHSQRKSEKSQHLLDLTKEIEKKEKKTVFPKSNLIGTQATP